MFRPRSVKKATAVPQPAVAAVPQEKPAVLASKEAPVVLPQSSVGQYPAISVTEADKTLQLQASERILKAKLLNEFILTQKKEHEFDDNGSVKSGDSDLSRRLKERYDGKRQIPTGSWESSSICSVDLWKDRTVSEEKRQTFARYISSDSKTISLAPTPKRSFSTSQSPQSPDDAETPPPVKKQKIDETTHINVALESGITDTNLDHNLVHDPSLQCGVTSSSHLPSLGEHSATGIMHEDGVVNRPVEAALDHAVVRDETNSMSHDSLNDLRAHSVAVKPTDGGVVAPKQQPLDIFAHPMPNPPQIDIFASGLLPKQVEQPRVEAKSFGVDDSDDEDGYHKFLVGSFVADKYRIKGRYGRGVYGSVFECYDTSRGDQIVALKMMRKNEMMCQAGMKESRILESLVGKKTIPDPRPQFIVQMYDAFNYRGHWCIATEAMCMNCRQLVKKYGDGKGIALKAVRHYSKQFLIALMQMANYIHADLKPDNLLVDEKLTCLKVCDFGTSLKTDEMYQFASEDQIVSRYYRAPEIVLCDPIRNEAIDIWSAGCCLYELYTGKILFTGKNNNHLLKSIMTICGRVPQKMINRSALGSRYFSETGEFKFEADDGRVELHTITIPEITFERRLLKFANEAEKPAIRDFADLISRMLTLDPMKRITAKQAYNHPFIRNRL